MSASQAEFVARDSVPASAIAGIVARVDALLGRAIEASAASTTSAMPDPLRGLFVSDADAGRLIRRGSEPLGQQLSFDRPIVDLSAAGPAWTRLADAFALSPAEVDVIALSLAPELDLRYERVYGYLHDDVTKRRLTPDLACQLLADSFDERLSARRLFAADSALVRHALVQLVPDPGQSQPSLISHAVKLDDGLIEFLLGTDDIDRRLASAVRWDHEPARQLPPEARDSTEVLQRHFGDAAQAAQAHFVLLGTDLRLKVDIARHTARGLEQPLLLVDLERLAHLDVPLRDAMRSAARTARLRGALTLWTRADRLGASSEDGAAALDGWLAAVDSLSGHEHLLAMSGTSPRRALEQDDRFVLLHLAAPDARARQRAWTEGLGASGVPIAADDLELLAEVFRLDRGAIERAIGRAVASARRRDPQRPEVAPADLFAAARAQILEALPRYATRIEGTYRWSDIVLPPDPLAQLRELCDRVRHRRIVLEEWGFGRQLALGKGVAALFAGPSGTGKTMAAQIIAATLGMELYRVEIPAVVSKYIGETEKALDQLFREAQGTSVILFFDEADALFGKRSEVKDAHDRYANIEISYLLQAIEQYDGLTILATNLKHNVDDAFVRRLAFSVTFPIPEEAERRRIWEKCLPERVPLAGDFDAGFLARQFKLTGGNIRNVALSAAFAAASDGGVVRMAHLIRGVRREFQKMGKTCVESEFGPYYTLLDAGR